jgi:uncharacterized protein with GYD domain
MAKYIVLLNYTQQGISKIKDSPHRAEAARALARECGAEMKDIYLTLGDTDLVAHVEADSDEAMARFALAVGSQGNVRSKTLRAFTEDEFREIVQSLPK